MNDLLTICKFLRPLPMALLLLCLIPPASFSAANGILQEAPVLPDLNQKRLLNDLQVIIASTPYLGESMTMGLDVRAGAVFDPAGKEGLANVLSRMFAKATLDKTGESLRNELQLLGLDYEVSCDWDSIRLTLRGESSNFERALLWLYQVVGEAEFLEEDFESVRSEILAELEQSPDPRELARGRFETALFRGTSYARSLNGTGKSLANLTVGDVRLFYRRHVSPNVSALVLAGSPPPALALQKASRIWGVWVRRDEIPFTFLPPRNPVLKQILLEDEPDSPAAQFILGNLAPRREERDFTAAVLASRILQDRLTKILPTSLLTVRVEGRLLPGPLYIQGQAAADQAHAEIQKIVESVEEFKNKAVSEEELASARRAWLDEFGQLLKTTTGVSSLILDSELYRLGTNYAASFPDQVGRITRAQLSEAAKMTLFPDGVLIYVRGPAATLRTGLETIGTLLPAPE